MEPCRRYDQKPKYCADVHKVHAGWAIRLESVEVVESG